MDGVACSMSISSQPIALSTAHIMQFYNVSGRVYKTFLGDNLQVALDFSPLGNRRKLDRQGPVRTRCHINYTTPVQYVGFSLTWNFSGGKKVKVAIVDGGIRNYHETKDNQMI